MVKAKGKLISLIFITRILGAYVFVTNSISQVYLGCILSHFEKRCSGTKRSGKFISVPGNDYVCPREDDPVTYIECCDYDSCCEKKTFFPELDEELVMIIGVTVITVCVILMAVIVICCFWSKCPCYTTCRANYTGSETVIYSLSKEDPHMLMPNESEGSQYAPCLVKIKRVDEF